MNGGSPSRGLHRPALLATFVACISGAVLAADAGNAAWAALAAVLAGTALILDRLAAAQAEAARRLDALLATQLSIETLLQERHW